MPQSLLIPRTEVVRGSRSEPDLPWDVMFWVAVGMMILGFVDASIPWIPFNVTEVVWRVKIIRGTMDALPLPTLGLAALLVVSARNNTNRALTIVALIAGIAFIIVVVLAALFLAGAMRFRAGGGANELGEIAIARTTFFAVIYAFIYALIAGAAAQRVIANKNAP